MQSPRILVVDDESSLRTALFRVLDRKGYQVITANGVQEAQTLSQTDLPIDLALIDLRLPDGNGMDLLKFVKKIHPKCEVIVLTGFGTVEDAVTATKEGAFHFLTKPFNIEELISLTEKALNHKDLQTENSALKNALESKYKFNNIIGQSDGIREVHVNTIEGLWTSVRNFLRPFRGPASKNLAGYIQWFLARASSINPSDAMQRALR